MNRVILLALTLFSLNLTALANIEQVEHEQMTKKQTPQKQQRMEQAPSSTPFGGARSGQLEIEKQRDEEKMSRNLEKQKQLYQYGDFYRRGL